MLITRWNEASRALPVLALDRWPNDWACQLTRVQTGYDVKEITAPPVQAMNIG